MLTINLRPNLVLGINKKAIFRLAIELSNSILAQRVVRGVYYHGDNGFTTTIMGQLHWSGWVGMTLYNSRDTSRCYDTHTSLVHFWSIGIIGLGAGNLY